MKFKLKKSENKLAHIASELSKLKKGYVKAGVLASEKERESGEVSNVDLALIHEFGAPAANIPERSFVRSTFTKNKQEYSALLKKLAKGLFAGKSEQTAEQILGLVGTKMAADMKNTITEGLSPANAPDVYARKLAKGTAAGLPKPLVDTGQLLDSITWDVVLGDKPKKG